MYCGDLYCGFAGDECYTFETNGTFEGWIGINIPTEDCNGCTSQLAYMDGWNSITSVDFCMPPECSEDETLDNLYTYGYGGYEDATWTITNLITGEEVSTGGINEGSSSNFMCFEDGIYELSVCDEDSGYDDLVL